MSVWPVNPAANFLPHPPPPGHVFKPRVGLGVICRCRPNTIDCLLLRRGPRFVSPFKWSFPGGRLGERGDLDDDGVKGTERELLKECGGGSPPGLPQLIHIECYKSQKTLYHVYAVNWEDEPEWLQWNPARTEDHTGEIDTTATELQIQDHTFKAVEGFCWVSLHTLVEECMSIGTTDQDKINASDLQHGLIRWVIANGETVLKNLSARSPKLTHHKRCPSSSSSSSTSSSVLTVPGMGGRGVASGQFRPMAFYTKAKRYLAGSAAGGGNDQFLLAPPLFPPSQLLHPTAMAVAASTQLTAASQGLSSVHASSAGGGVYPVSQDFQSGLLTLQVPMGSGVFGAAAGQSSLLSQEQMALVQQQQQQQPARQTNGLPQQPNSVYIPPGVGHATGQMAGIVVASSSQGSTQNTSRPSTGNGEPALGGYVHPETALGEAAGLTPGVVGIQGLPPPQGFPSTGGVATLPSVTSTTHTNPVLSAHSTLGMDPVAAVAAAGGTQHQPGEGSALLSSPQVPTPVSNVIQAGRMADHQTSPAMVNSVLPGNQGEFGHVLAHGSPIRRQPPPAARTDICRHFLNGHCHYGDMCWFAHPEPHHYMRRRDPLLGPGGIMTNSPLPLPVGGTWLSPGAFADHSVPQYGPQSPPQSPLGVVNPGLNSTTWQHMAAIANAASTGRLPLPHTNLGGGLPGHQMRPFMYPGGRFAGSHAQLPPSTIANPVLRFKLLSEVLMRDGNGSIVGNISHLAVRADHFYSCFAKTVRGYKVLFGGERRSSDSHMLTAQQVFGHCVSCIHSSKLLQSLLVVGTEDGSIFTWDLKKGGNNSDPVPVHEAEGDEEPVTALVHFTTTIASAQVVVSGNRQGVVTWYIAQPPMKTYIVLASRKFDTPNPVLSLQILGGYLIAGSKNGMVCMWSMRSQEPEFFSQFQAHSECLLDIHIIDSSSFLTVGMDGNGSPSLPPSAPTTSTTVTERVEATGQISLETTQADDSAPPHNAAIDTVSSELASLAIVTTGSSQSSRVPSYVTQSSSVLYHVTFWDFGKPMRRVKTQGVTGPILSTNFHQQPMFGNRFLAMGLTNGAVKIYNLPSFSVASEIRFPDIENKDCIFVALNLSREKENTHHVNVKNPFRDLILTTVWSNGRIMVCQTDRKF